MPQNRVVDGVTWTPNPEGEYNEHVATIKGKKVTVSSDRDESRWDCFVDEGELISLDAESLYEALKEAKQCVN